MRASALPDLSAAGRRNTNSTSGQDSDICGPRLYKSTAHLINNSPLCDLLPMAQGRDLWRGTGTGDLLGWLDWVLCGPQWPSSVIYCHCELAVRSTSELLPALLSHSAVLLPIKASSWLTICHRSGEQPQAPPKSCDYPSPNPRGSNVILLSLWMSFFPLVLFPQAAIALPPRQSCAVVFALA